MVLATSLLVLFGMFSLMDHVLSKFFRFLGNQTHGRAFGSK